MRRLGARPLPAVYRTWSVREVATCRYLWGRGYPLADIALALPGRTPQAIQCYIVRHGFRRLPADKIPSEPKGRKPR